MQIVRTAWKAGGHCHPEALGVPTCHILLSPDSGLTKEPVLCMLVSKEPPAPAAGTRDTGHNRGQKAGLSINWAVPNMLAKDVPNFEQLSPELEAGTAPSFLPFLTEQVPALRGLGAAPCSEGAPFSEDPLTAWHGARGPDLCVSHLSP